MSKRKSKPLPFSEKELYLLNWAENRDKPFATYVKDLIREDIKKHSTTTHSDLESIVKDIISKMNIEIKPPEVKKTGGLSEKSKSAVKNLLKK